VTIESLVGFFSCFAVDYHEINTTDQQSKNASQGHEKGKPGESRGRKTIGAKAHIAFASQLPKDRGSFFYEPLLSGKVGFFFILGRWCDYQ
jgi:hypothetical protein